MDIECMPSTARILKSAPRAILRLQIWLMRQGMGAG
jgi:hypothetical protein